MNWRDNPNLVECFENWQATLRGLAAQFERGELDQEFAEAQVPIADMRETVVQRIRQLADTLESGG